jgi:alpha-amylase
MTRIPVLLAALLGGLAAAPAAAQAPQPAAGAEWWRDAVCYQVFVRSFQDSDGDGIGDLRGLIQRLDYINDGDPNTTTDLGARCIWLMPVAQSPTYHGYDVTDYYRVERDYGTNEDFRALMAEANRRGIRVIVDLVLNHSSSEHPWFKSAMIYPDSPFRSWFRFSPTAPDVRGPWGQQVWHRSPHRDEHYFAIFIDGMPDLELDNPEVRAETERIARFWLQEMGVDGFRLDAVTHFFEDGALMKHLPRTHTWLREYQQTLRRIRPDVFTIGEVWDSTGAMLPYYPDQLDSYFAFEAADGILNAVQTGTADQLFAAVQRLQRDVPEGRWAPFIRNHDQTRTLTVLGGDVGRNRVAATLLLTLPGTPFLYYGEEIGMTGDKIGGTQPDPRLRTPMHWSLGQHAGFSTQLPWEPLQPDSMTANVEAQTGDPRSLLSHHRNLVHARNGSVALRRGDFVPLTSSTPGAAAFLRRQGDQTVLVLVNLTDRRLGRVTLGSADATLAAGQYAGRALVGGRAAQALRVGANGRIQRWAPLPALEPHGSYVIELTHAGRR